jgi:alkanesulfonate monooxygenase
VSIVLHWYLPAAGDGRTLLEANRAVATPEQLVAVARAAQDAGFDAVLTPTGTWCDDAWITTAAVSQHVDRLRFLVAFRPGTLAPMLAAQQAAAFHKHTRGRLLLNIVTGGEDVEQRRYGDGLDKNDRYARTDEFLTILRGAWRGIPFDFRGRHLWAEGALAPAVDPPPPIYFGGASEAALRVAVRHADVYLTWGEPPPAVARRVERVSELAATEGRAPRFGIRLHVVARADSDEAWRAANALLADADEATIAAAQRALAAESSVGQRRMVALHGGSREQLEVYPNLWAGVGLLRGGAGTALVGSFDEVAERIGEYHALGIDEFILSGYPHDEQAVVFGTGVVPALRARGLLAEAPSSVLTEVL